MTRKIFNPFSVAEMGSGAKSKYEPVEYLRSADVGVPRKLLNFGGLSAEPMDATIRDNTKY